MQGRSQKHTRHSRAGSGPSLDDHAETVPERAGGEAGVNWLRWGIDGVCQVKSQVFRAETETARDVALSKLELLDYHSQRGWVVSKTAPRSVDS